MIRVGGLAILFCALALSACGDDGTSAADLEQRLTEASPFEDPDPVVEADCPDDLPSDSDAEVTCTTTTKSGAVSEVTVVNSGEDGISFTSVSVDPPAGEDSGPPPDPKIIARLERGIDKTHDGDVTDDSRQATAVDCPDDFVERAGVTTTCAVTLADGSVIDYTVRVFPRETIWYADPYLADMLAAAIKDHWNGQGPPLVDSVECPEALPMAKGTATTCTLHAENGKSTEGEVTVTSNTRANFDIEYGPLR